MPRRRSPLALTLLLLGCTAVQSGLGPRPVGSSIDETATSCLDWAWNVTHTREVAGGVVWQGDLLACTELTLGTRNAVRTASSRTGSFTSTPTRGRVG